MVKEKKEKNIILMATRLYYLKENIQMGKDGMENYIMKKEIQNLK